MAILNLIIKYKFVIVFVVIIKLRGAQYRINFLEKKIYFQHIQTRNINFIRLFIYVE